MSRNIIFSLDEYYHVYNRGTDKRIIFLDEFDYKRFTLLLYICNSTERVDIGDLLRQGLALSKIYDEERSSDTLVDIGAWVLMPNHFHILIKEKKEKGITTFLQKLLTSYSMYFNHKYQRKGSLFEGPFKAKHLDSDNYLKYQFAYIHLNPIGIIDSSWKNRKISDKNRAKLFLDNYIHSSYMDYCEKDRLEGKVLSRQAFPKYFNNTQDFRKMIKECMEFNG